MMSMGNVTVAFDEAELREKLDHIDELLPKEKIGPIASGSLVQGLRAFIHSK
jgi:hypothetical protein